MYYYLLVTSISCMHGYIRYNVWIYINEGGGDQRFLIWKKKFHRILTLDPYPEGKRKEKKKRKKKNQCYRASDIHIEGGDDTYTTSWHGLPLLIDTFSTFNSFLLSPLANDSPCAGPRPTCQPDLRKWRQYSTCEKLKTLKSPIEQVH